MKANHNYTPNGRSSVKDLFWADENFMKERDLIWEEYKKKTKDIPDFKLKSKTWYMGDYGTKNAEDFMAECFSEFQNSSTPSVYAKKVGGLVDKYYKKKT